jgi:hypothetical protein
MRLASPTTNNSPRDLEVTGGTMKSDYRPASRGFWDGGNTGHHLAKNAAGRVGGLPGIRTSTKLGLRTEVEPRFHIRRSDEKKGK